MNKETKLKSMEDNFCYRADFQYTHKNPYHDKLAIFDEFVLRDEDSEKFKNNWKEKVFLTQAETPLHVEIGTGYGDFMLEYCQNNPKINFIGLDHRFKRSFHLSKKLASLEHKNFKYLRARGERLDFIFGENEIEELFYFFPDPWPKTRHFKKRLFQKPFLDSVHRILKNKGLVWIKTDHDGYFEWMLKHLENDPRFKITFQSYDLRATHPEHFLASFTTRFENLFLKKGIKIKALVLENIK